ncbi:hypothetical protein Pogu_0939 [Pyrobaculum oguniense TE7]|uniref:Uncharacterized protein n=1 Tax=Pyrobaculum oguniense (strain DSM 13380 / JCM 10595 / TE7) TaxID=698757 RepID=H6Q8F9_PYROT|nr:hypothetical protein Pogu_0939 [Pyrobaculum oguniense TE7]
MHTSNVPPVNGKVAEDIAAYARGDEGMRPIAVYNISSSGERAYLVVAGKGHDIGYAVVKEKSGRYRAEGGGRATVRHLGDLETNIKYCNG